MFSNFFSCTYDYLEIHNDFKLMQSYSKWWQNNEEGGDEVHFNRDKDAYRSSNDSRNGIKFMGNYIYLISNH